MKNAWRNFARISLPGLLLTTALIGLSPAIQAADPFKAVGGITGNTPAAAAARRGTWHAVAWGVCWEAPFFNGQSCQFPFQGKLWQADRIFLYNKTPGAVCTAYGQWGIQGPPVPRISPTPCWGCGNTLYMERRLVMACN